MGVGDVMLQRLGSVKSLWGEEIMKKVSIVGIIMGIGLLTFLKVSQNSIPRISDPLTNYIILIGVVLFAILYGVSQLKKNRK